MRITNLLLIALASGLLFSHAAIGGKYNAVLNIGDKMPEFTDLPDISGNNISSNELTESVLVLVSLANHCPWVRGMDQDLVKLAADFEEQDVRIVALSMNHREDDRLPAMKAHAEKNGYHFNYLYDETQELGRQLGATRTPEYFVFNKERKLVYMGLLHNSPGKISSDGSVNYINGNPNEFYVQKAVEATLSGNTVGTTETRAHGCTIKYVK